MKYIHHTLKVNLFLSSMFQYWTHFYLSGVLCGALGGRISTVLRNTRSNEDVSLSFLNPSTPCMPSMVEI